MERGVDALKAALTAASLRFRPILMTSLAFVLGMLPLVMASGPGSASRHSIGTGVFFGMLAAITVGLSLIHIWYCCSRLFLLPVVTVLYVLSLQVVCR